MRKHRPAIVFLPRWRGADWRRVCLQTAVLAFAFARKCVVSQSVDAMSSLWKLRTIPDYSLQVPFRRGCHGTVSQPGLASGSCASRAAKLCLERAGTGKFGRTAAKATWKSTVPANFVRRASRT